MTLAQAGFHEDALIMGRAILELALHGRYVLAVQDDAERTFRAASFIYDGDRQRGTKHDQILKLKAEGKCASWIAGLEAEGPFQPVTTPLRPPASKVSRTLSRWPMRSAVNG